MYPRILKVDGQSMLVCNDQIVGAYEYLATTHRILFLSGTMSGDFDTPNLLIAMGFLSHDPVKIIISSMGGDLDSAFLFYDIIRTIQSPIITIGKFCASAAVLILASGKERYLYPHAKVMMHLARGQMSGDYKDFETQRLQMNMYQNKFIDILLDCGAKKTRKQILEDMDREFWLEPKEAIEYGLADEILTPEIWQKMIKEEKHE